MQLVVALLDCPEIQRKCGHFVDFGNRGDIFGEIDDHQVRLAGFTREEPQVGQVVGCEGCEVGFRCFIAARAP